MKRGYLAVFPYLPDGEYKSKSKLNWHEKLRVRLAYWLFASVPKPDGYIVTTTSSHS